MSGKSFLDSNILIYAHDLDAGFKHDVCGRILRELWTANAGLLSMQVLQEFYVNATRKMRVPLTHDDARSAVTQYAVWCVETTPQEIFTAFRIEDEARINFWDALIVAAAANAGAERILSEDLNHGQRIAGVRIENPFLSE